MRHRVRRAEDELRRLRARLRNEETTAGLARERLSAIVSAMRDGLFLMDRQGGITRVNEAARELVQGLEQDEIGPVSPCCPSPKRDCRACLTDFSKPTGTCLVTDGTRTYEIHTTTLRTEERATERVFVSRDVTRRMEDREQQAHQERLSVLGEIAAVMAHELNNPLAAIRMFNRMVLDGLPADSPLQEHVSVIERNIGACQKTIRSLLDMASRNAPTRETVDLRETVREAVRLLEPLLTRTGIALCFDFGAEPSRIRGKELQVRQVVVNLLLNALQAIEKTGEGGEIQVRIEQEGEEVAVTIEDDGPGLPPEIRHRIFDAFFTTRNEGTGLGLSTARQIMETHRGRLELLRSRPGDTAFRATFRQTGLRDRDGGQKS